MKRFVWILIATTIVLAGCNLAGDITPPPGVSTGPVSLPTQVATSPPVEAEPPSSAPVVDQGEAIYEQRCAPCHGPTGLGDGEQASELPVAPSALADPELARPAVPADWYQIVTVGRMDRFMPPFSSLSDQQRWDVVGYALSLGHGQQAVSQGAELYQQHCAECHGDQAEGTDDGPSLADPQSYAQLSRSQMAAAIGAGIGSMPGFSQELSEDEIWATTAYLQNLTLTSQGTAEAEGETEAEGEAEAEEAEVVEADGVIQGQAQNGTDGQLLSAGFEVTLHAFDGQTQVLEETVETNADGSYTFEGLEQVPGRLYVVSAEFQGVRYTSEVLHLSEAGEGPLQLPITIYETTSDGSNLQAARVHLLIDQPNETTLRMVELWVVVNTGERTVVPAEGGGVRFLLPEKATNLQFEDSMLAERYTPIEGGFQLAQPLRPGGQGAQIVFSYDVPFEGTIELVHPLTMPVSAVTVLVAGDGPQVEGDQIIDRGQRQAGGEQFHQYDLPAMTAEQDLRLTLRGPSFLARLTPQNVDLSWAIGAAVLLIALAVIAWWYRPWISAAASDDESRSARDRTLEERKEWLMTAIADLDDAFEQGKVEEAAYRRRRQELKSQLIDLMKRLDD